MLNVVANHRCYLLEINFITSALYIKDFIQKAHDVFFLEVAHEFTEEFFEALIGNLVLTLVEYFQ
jgi:hypothetical protein